MIFGLPAILGLLPILIYAVLGFKGVHPLLAISAGLLSATILAGKSFMDLAASIPVGAGSFLGTIGLMVMLGTALAEMLKDTGAASLLVRKIMNRFPVNTMGILIGSMVSIVILTVGIGSMIAAATMVSTVAVTLAATYKVSPTAMSIAFHTGSIAGLILGPFTPTTVQILTMTGMTFWEHLFSIALPFVIMMFITGAFMSSWAQKRYGEKGEGVLYPSDETANMERDVEPTKQAKRGARGFIFTVIPLMLYGIFIGGGMNFALLMIITCSITTGLAAGYSFDKITKVIISGASRMTWYFLMFALFDPFIKFVGDTGAFVAVGELLGPLIDTGGSVGFLMIGSLIGVFGISGATAVQIQIMHEMFEATAVSLGLGIPLYYTMLLVGSLITSFAYPGADMMTELGLARSNHIKSLIINGRVVMIVMALYMLARALLNI